MITDSLVELRTIVYQTIFLLHCDVVLTIEVGFEVVGVAYFVLLWQTFTLLVQDQPTILLYQLLIFHHVRCLYTLGSLLVMNFLRGDFYLVVRHIVIIVFAVFVILQAVLFVGFLPLDGSDLILQDGFDDSDMLEYICHVELFLTALVTLCKDSIPF